MTPIHTIGHSTRSTDDFLALLGEQEISCLVDVRRFPASRRHPHFAREPLSESARVAGIAYVHEPDLGGYRKPHGDSPNTGWRVAGFQAYADHMDTPEFEAALERLIRRSGAGVVAIMCAEAVPWRCHRQLISDALVARGHDVVHILGSGQVQPHALSEHARVLENGRLIYPEPGADQMGLFSEQERSSDSS